MKKEKKKINILALFQGGVILSLLHRFFDRARLLLANGLFAKLFTAYTKEEEMLQSGFLSRIFGRKGKYGGFAATTKLRIARLFESGMVIGWLEKLGNSVLYRKTKTYASFCLSFGVSGIVLYLIKEFALSNTTGKASDLVICGGAILLAVPMFLSSETLAAFMLKSKMMKPVLFDYFGFSKDAFVLEKEMPRAYSVSVALGIAFGILTYFIDPIYYLAFFVIFLSLSLIFRIPELGVLLFVGLIPFSHYITHSTAALVINVLTVSLAYLIKWIRGKRVLKWRLLDKAVAFLMLMFALGGIFSAGGKESFLASMIYVVFFLAYFLIVNLLRSEAWVTRTWKTFLFSGLASSVLGIAEIFTGQANASWVDMNIFQTLGVRITGGFDNPNVYAEYLLILLPLAFLLFLTCTTGKGRLASAIALLILSVCMVYTWSRGAWLGLLVAFLFFLLAAYKYAPIGFLGLGLAFPLVSVFIPQSVTERFMSIGNLADSSISYRLSVWKGLLHMLNETEWSGTGVGYAAFSSVYPAFAYGGSAYVRHAHNWYLQTVAEIGLGGLLALLAVLFLFAQMCFEYLSTPDTEYGKLLTVTGLSSVFGLMVMGLTDHIWYDYRIFLSFWIMVALVSAYIRIRSEEKERSMAYYENTDTGATLDIQFNMFE